MAYSDRAELKSDPLFRGRLDACVLNEAIAKPADPFVDDILSKPNYGLESFLPLVISLPGFDRPEPEITDGDLLSGVQTVWSRVQELSGTAP
jgi:hypothetical protein